MKLFSRARCFSKDDGFDAHDAGSLKDALNADNARRYIIMISFTKQTHAYTLSGQRMKIK